MTTPAPIPDDTTEVGDDGAEYAFWAFIVARRLRRLPDYDLTDPAVLEAAVATFEASR